MSHSEILLCRLFSAYTLDVIAGTGLGLETNSLTEDNNPFLTNAKAVLGSSNLVTASSVLAGNQVFAFVSKLTVSANVPVFVGCILMQLHGELDRLEQADWYFG